MVTVPLLDGMIGPDEPVGMTMTAELDEIETSTDE